MLDNWGTLKENLVVPQSTEVWNCRKTPARNEPRDARPDQRKTWDFRIVQRTLSRQKDRHHHSQSKREQSERVFTFKTLWKPSWSYLWYLPHCMPCFARSVARKLGDQGIPTRQWIAQSHSTAVWWTHRLLTCLLPHRHFQDCYPQDGRSWDGQGQHLPDWAEGEHLLHFIELWLVAEAERGNSALHWGTGVQWSRYPKLHKSHRIGSKRLSSDTAGS